MEEMRDCFYLKLRVLIPMEVGSFYELLSETLQLRISLLSY
jgi:hypothetical protein